MKHFLKENTVLVAGVTLPLLLTLVFFVATQWSGVSNEIPRYSVIFTNQSSYQAARSPYQFIVKKDQLYLSYTALEKDQNRAKPRLYVFDPLTNISKEIELPAIDVSDKKIDKLLTFFDTKNVSSLLKSPDGYVFKSDYRSNVNILTGLFGGGNRSRNRVTLSNGSSNVIVPGFNRYNTHFVAWVVGVRGAENEQ